MFQFCVCASSFSLDATEIYMGSYNKGENYSFVIKVRKTCFHYLFVCAYLIFNAHMKNFCLLFKWQWCRHKGEAGPKVKGSSLGLGIKLAFSFCCVFWGYCWPNHVCALNCALGLIALFTFVGMMLTSHRTEILKQNYFVLHLLSLPDILLPCAW